MRIGILIVVALQLVASSANTPESPAPLESRESHVSQECELNVADQNSLEQVDSDDDFPKIWQLITPASEIIKPADDATLSGYVEDGRLTADDAVQILTILRKVTYAPISGSRMSDSKSFEVVVEREGSNLFSFEKREGRWVYSGAGFMSLCGKAD